MGMLFVMGDFGGWLVVVEILSFFPENGKVLLFSVCTENNKVLLFCALRRSWMD